MHALPADHTDLDRIAAFHCRHRRDQPGKGEMDMIQLLQPHFRFEGNRLEVRLKSSAALRRQRVKKAIAGPGIERGLHFAFSRRSRRERAYLSAARASEIRAGDVGENALRILFVPEVKFARW